MTEPYYVLEVRTADGATETHNVSEEKRFIGRSKVKADLRVEDKKASGRHAEIDFSDGVITVTDLGSTNGTFFGGARVTAPFTLGPGDTFKMGDAVLRLIAVHGLEDELKTQVSMMSWDEDEPVEATRALDAAEIAAATGIALEDETIRQPAPEPVRQRPAPQRRPEPVVVQPEPVMVQEAEPDGDDWANDYSSQPAAAPRRPVAPPSSEVPIELDKKQTEAMAAIDLRPGEFVTHVWEGDGITVPQWLTILGDQFNFPVEALKPVVVGWMRFMLFITGGFIHVYIVLTSHRLIVVESARTCFGAGKGRVSGVLAANGVHTVGISKDTKYCCIHRRVISVLSTKRAIELRMRKFNDDDAREFMSTMALNVLK